MARALNSRIQSLKLLLTFLALALTPAMGNAGEGGAVLKVVPRVVPFDLTQVRLLPGLFNDAMERDKKFLLGIDLDRLLYNFRVNAGLPTTAQPYGGWEAPNVELRGHSVGHFLTACSFMYASTGDGRFKDRADSVVAILKTVQDALPARGFHPGYLSAFPEEFIDRVEQRKPVWAPYYTLHKILAGLLDCYIHCGNEDALGIVKKMADWVRFRMERLTIDQQQAMLRTEFGGMNDVLANLAVVTGNAGYLQVAKMFDDQAVFRPLGEKRDSLDGLHGNTQFPKMIGAVHEYELTGDRTYHEIASYFWDRVVNYRSYVIGGNTNDEHFFPIQQFSKNLGAASTETCNSYNMLKLTRELFTLDPTADKMDFYERALYNHILASQDPSTGMMCYYVPLKPGAFKTFSTPDRSFWCCVGTGMENHSKYGESIYAHSDTDLYVNLFIPSQLTWKERNLVLRQETRFPEEEGTHLSLNLKRATRLNLRIRHPDWAESMSVNINGKPQKIDSRPGSYVTLSRRWNNGDRIDVALPMHLRIERMPDDSTIGAILYGPIVLAGDLGREGMDQVQQYGPSAPPMRKAAPVAVPVFVSADNPLNHVHPDSGQALVFETDHLGQPHDVVLRPFYRIAADRYSVYWNFLSPDAWAVKRGEKAVRESRRNEIENLTIDAVDIDNRENEKAHGFKGEKAGEHWFDDRRGRESKGGWFSYLLQSSPSDSLILVCTFRGSEGPLRSFDVLVDSQKVANQSLEIHPGELFDYEYPLPLHLTTGKKELTVMFRAHAGAIAGAVFDVRLVRAAPIKK